MPNQFYQDKIYPFQDKILKTVETLDTDFYLTGGTALSRCYLQHRYSDDLDLFVNDNDDFKAQCDLAVAAFKKKWGCEIASTTDSFVRIFLEEEGGSIKIDFVNDVPFHYGDTAPCPIFTRVDNWRNILSNKICALSRLEPKDVADILFISKNYIFEWEEIINEAKEKDLWVDPIDVCRVLKSFGPRSFLKMKWIKDIDPNEINSFLNKLHDDIFFGRENSIKNNS
jgi:hypothetical protein